MLSRFHIESWSEWDPQPCAYRAHALTTEISGQTILILNFLKCLRQNQIRRSFSCSLAYQNIPSRD